MEIPSKLLDTKGSGLETLYMNRWGLAAPTLSLSTSESQEDDAPPVASSSSLSWDNSDDQQQLYEVKNKWQASRNLFIDYGSTSDSGYDYE